MQKTLGQKIQSIVLYYESKPFNKHILMRADHDIRRMLDMYGLHNLEFKLEARGKVHAGWQIIVVTERPIDSWAIKGINDSIPAVLANSANITFDETDQA